MVTIPYLYTRRGRFYFRRRIPKFSTYHMPVMVSLGTTDHSAANRLCVQLTAHMDRMLDNGLHIDLPTADVSAFSKAELTRCVASVHRMRMVERMDGSLTAGYAHRAHYRLPCCDPLCAVGLAVGACEAYLNNTSP